MRFAFILILLAAPLACQGKGQHAEPAGRSAAKVVELQGKTIDREPFDLADYRGKVVLLNVWASWCAPCKQELPELQSLHERWSSQGFSVIGISIDKPGALGQVHALVDRFDLKYPIMFDPDGQSVVELDVLGYPTSFILDKHGAVRWKRTGLIREQDAEVLAEIQAALAEPGPA